MRFGNLGARYNQNELCRLHGIELGIATIHKILTRNEVKPVVIYRIKPDYIRYVRLILGDRVQVDNCKIRPNL